MTLNDLLRGKNIDPETVLVFRHRPSAPELNKALPWFAAEKPDVFNAYQQTQGSESNEQWPRPSMSLLSSVEKLAKPCSSGLWSKTNGAH